MKGYDEMLDVALLSFVRGKSAEAEALEVLLECYPDGPHGRALFAVHRLWSGDLEGAQSCAAALGEHPAELGARAEVASYLGDGEASTALIERALREAPDDPVVLRCATSVLGLSDPPRMLELAQRRATLRPHDPGAHASVGTALIQVGALDEAERLAADPPEGFMGTSSLSHLRAQLAMRRHDLTAAESHAREAVALGPDLGMPWGTLADVLKFQGRKEEAEQAACFALEVNPRNPIPLRVMANLARARGDRNAASEWERKAQEAIPALKFMSALDEANELTRQSKPQEAIAVLERLRDAPGSVRHAARAIRVNLLLSSDDDEALVREAEEMGSEGVQNELRQKALAELDRRAGRLELARERLTTLWEDGHPGGIAGPLVRVLAGLDDLDEARQVAAEATANLPGTPGDVAALFLALDKAGLREEARTLLGAAERRYPQAQLIALLRVGTLAEDRNVPMMLQTIRGLDEEHRLKFRFRLPLLKLLKVLWTALRRKAQL